MLTLIVVGRAVAAEETTMTYVVGVSASISARNLLLLT
jgi:hypothetical protein